MKPQWKYTNYKAGFHHLKINTVFYNNNSLKKMNHMVISVDGQNSMSIHDSSFE